MNGTLSPHVQLSMTPCYWAPAPVRPWPLSAPALGPLRPWPSMSRMLSRVLDTNFQASKGALPSSQSLDFQNHTVLL